jgi:hypothetical protein
MIITLHSTSQFGQENAPPIYPNCGRFIDPAPDQGGIGK